MPLKLHRRGKRYYLRGTVAGQRVYESTGLDNRKAAEIFRARREAEIIDRHTYGRSATTTFAEAALTYLESGGDGRFLAPILQHFGPHFRLADIDSRAALDAAAALYPRAAPATINRQVITPISAVYCMAADDGLCPPRRFRRMKEPATRLRWLTPEEAERLITAADARLRPIIAFLIGTGCRTDEMISLQRQHLHLDTLEAWIARTKNGDAKMVRYPLRTRRILASAGLPETGAVFRTPKGLPYKHRTNGGGQIQAAFNAARDAAQLGRDVTPHTLRHTWATWHYAMNRDTLELMQLGGWRRPDMALRYAKLAPADLADRLLDHGWNFRRESIAIDAPARDSRITRVK